MYLKCIEENGAAHGFESLIYQQIMQRPSIDSFFYIYEPFVFDYPKLENCSFFIKLKQQFYLFVKSLMYLFTIFMFLGKVYLVVTMSLL